MDITHRVKVVKRCIRFEEYGKLMDRLYGAGKWNAESSYPRLNYKNSAAKVDGINPMILVYKN